jgi:hypothetical protein
MYLVPLKGAVVEALRATFNNTYPESDFQGVWSSIEFPVAKASYPGIWVTYEDTDEVSIAGIGHVEVVTDDQGVDHTVTRSRFGGVITMTCVALSSLERDRLYDELVRTLIFARQEIEVSAFRDRIENNDLVAMNADFDKIRAGGDAAAPGTPWGTDEMIYERSISINVIGEFISTYGQLYRLSQIHTQGYAQGSKEPAFPDDPPNDPLDPGIPGWDDTHFEITTPPPSPLQPAPIITPVQPAPFTTANWH